MRSFKVSLGIEDAYAEFVSHPRASIVDLYLLPLSLSPRIEEPEENVKPGATYQSKVHDETPVIKRIGKTLSDLSSPKEGVSS